jgi:hypothetical protein
MKQKQGLAMASNLIVHSHSVDISELVGRMHAESADGPRKQQNN